MKLITSSSFKPTASITPGLRLDGYIEHGTSRVYWRLLGAQFPDREHQRQLGPSNKLEYPRGVDAEPAHDRGKRDMAATTSAGGRIPTRRRHMTRPYPRYERSTSQWSQNTNWWFHEDSSVHTASAVVSHFVDGVFGVAHELKIGTSTRQRVLDRSNAIRAAATITTTSACPSKWRSGPALRDRRRRAATSCTRRTRGL
jgi:hypothetical protein